MPPFRFTAYENETAPTLINLIRQGGQDRARAIETGGQAAANAALASGQASAQIGQVVGNTLANLVQIPEQKKAYELHHQEQALRTRQVDEATKQYQQKDLIDKVMQKTGGDPEATLRELRQADPGAAETFSTHLHTARMSALDESAKQLDVTGKALNTARQLLPVRPTDPKDEAGQVIYRQQYKDARDGISKIIGPDLSKSLPDPTDPELFTKVQQLEEWGMTQAQVLQQRRLALQIAQDGVKAQQEGRNADAYHTKALGTYLSTAQSQEEWTQAIQNAKHMGASDETLAKFGEAFSPEAVQRAGTLGQVKVDKVTPGTPEDAIVTWAKEHNRPVQSLSLVEKNRIRSQYAAATREPDKGPSSEATIAQKAQAERWKSDQLQRVEERYRASNAPYLDASGKITIEKDKDGHPVYFPDRGGSPIIPMSLGDLEKAKAQVQKSYMAQVNAGGQPAASPAAPEKIATPAAAPKVGSPVTYNGKKYIVTGINNGKATLKPAP